ncbi:MAG: hypothetical protein ABR596_02630 [Halarsenatibacteraceae bacterium]
MITIKEAAEYADKSESWIRKKILSGELKAEKNPFKYGERWETTKKNIDDLLEDLKAEREVLEIREVNKPVSKDQLLNELVEAISEQNKDDIKNISSKLQELNQKLIKENQELIRENEKLRQQVDQLQEQLNKGLKDKLKELFRG